MDKKVPEGIEITPEFYPPSGYYYHITPEKRLPKILREGLRGGSQKSLVTPSEVYYPKRIYLGRTLGDVLYQLDISDGSPEISKTRNWAILRVKLPSSFKVYVDTEGFLYTTRSIPPRCLSIERRDSELHRRIRGE